MVREESHFNGVHVTNPNYNLNFFFLSVILSSFIGYALVIRIPYIFSLIMCIYFPLHNLHE